MKGLPQFKIGHLKIIDHLILGVVDHQLKKKKTPLVTAVLDAFAFNSWNQLCEQLTHGHINGAFITIPAAINLFASGLDIRLLMFTHRGGSIIVKKKSSRITGIKDFKDHTVLVPAELCVQNMFLHRLLSSAGLEFGIHSDKNAQVVRETASPYLMPQMLESDSDDDIAGFAVAEPYGSQAILQNQAACLCHTDKLWKNHPCCAFVLTNQIIEQHPDAVSEIINRFVRAAHTIETQKDQLIYSIAGQFLDQDQAIVRHVLSTSGVCFTPDLLQPDPEAIGVIYKYMHDTMGIITKKIDVSHFIDPSFMATITTGNQP